MKEQQFLCEECGTGISWTVQLDVARLVCMPQAISKQALMFAMRSFEGYSVHFLLQMLHLLHHKLHMRRFILINEI